MATWRSTARSDPLTLLRAAAAALVLALMAAACGGAEDAGTGPSSSRDQSAAGSPSASTAQDAERAAVEQAYERFWTVSWTVDRLPAAQWRATLAEVAVDPQLTRLVEGTRVQVRNGIRLYGQVVPRVTDVTVQGGQARVVDCQSAAKAGQADARTGKPKTVGVDRTPVRASLQRGADHVWRVSDIQFTGGSC